MPHATRRHLLRAAFPAAATLGLGAALTPRVAIAADVAAADVTAFGAKGDGQTPSAEGFQRAIDAVEAAGGGWVTVPAGLFLLERTPLIGSRVHLRGAGAATVLRGLRPAGHQGAALISNKGQQASGYDGAHDWSISHLAIDSPDTNGIVVTHARRVYLGFIHGIDVYNHFIDLAGREVLCEQLLLTGQSGTSSFQIDSLHGAQAIWDGARAVSPNLDGTETRDLILRSSIITARAGRQGDRPRHDASVHFHGGESGGMQFSDLVLGGAATGIYQDADTHYDDLQIANVRSSNHGHAVLLNPGRRQQRNCMITGLIHAPDEVASGDAPYRGIAIHGRHGLALDRIQLRAPAGARSDYGVFITDSAQVSLRGLQFTGNGGSAIRLRDRHDDGPGRMRTTLVQGCQAEGFTTGCEYDRNHEGEAPVVEGNLFAGE